jgi:putative heme iron utilization protein
MTDVEEEPRRAARLLLRAARVGTLATQAGGQPFAGLVTPATAADLCPLLLLSELSQHTRELRSDPRCALLVAGEPVEANPQTAPRLLLQGTASVTDAAEDRARFLAVHPYAALYAGFGDFHLWRLAPTDGNWVGGFAQARKLRFADLRPEPAAMAALAEAAAGIMEHCNADHADTMALLAGSPGAWRMVGVDTDGCDLACDGQRVRRVAWRQQAAGAGDVRRALIALAREARGMAAAALD